MRGIARRALRGWCAGYYFCRESAVGQMLLVKSIARITRGPRSSGKPAPETRSLAAAVILAITASATAPLAQPADAPSLGELQERVVQLKRENARLDAEAARVDSLARAEAQRFDRLQAARKKDLAKRARQFEELGEKLRGVKAEIAEEERRTEAAVQAVREVEAAQAALIQILEQLAGRLEELVRATIPWERESRLGRIAALRRELTAGLEPPEGFSRLEAILDEEIRFGDEIALHEKPVLRNNGQEVNARILRLGNQGMVYTAQGDALFGVLERLETDSLPQYTWREDLDFAERRAVRQAVDVRSAAAPPQWTPLPFRFEAGSLAQGDGDDSATADHSWGNGTAKSPAGTSQGSGVHSGEEAGGAAKPPKEGR